MSSVKPTQVSPVGVKTNNYISGDRHILSDLKSFIILESLVGINRVFLFTSKKITQYFSCLYCFGLLILTVYYVYRSDIKTASYVLIKQSLCVEYSVLIINALLSNKKKWKKFFSSLDSFDAMLSIHKDIVNMVSRKGSIWFLISLFYIAMENILLSLYMPAVLGYFLILPYLMCLAHDCEIIFFCALLKLIYIRLCVLKAHVAKAFSVDEEPINAQPLNKIELLANRAQLGISSLHKAYELLHKCSEKLNSLMSFQMIIILFTSGFSTTMLLKNAVKIIQLTQVDTPVSKATIVYIAMRCTKYTIFVVLPCHYSSIISKQVTYIRSALHDAVNSTKLDKMERRKLKAFFQLTRESEFSYALWGMIRLNMTLPLSYLSLCTTYLVIIIQFSKFID